MGGGTTIVGREPLLQRIATHLAGGEGAAGGGARIELVGEPGCGKTALLAAVRAKTHHRVIAITGVETDVSQSLGAVRAVLRSLPDIEVAALTPAHREAIESVEGSGTIRQSDQIGGALAELFARACSDDRVLFVIDDAHWLDDASARVLLDAFARVSGDPFTVVVASRPVEADRFAGFERIAVPNLEGADALDVLARFHIVPEVAEVVVRSTAGNPLGLVTVAEGLSERQRLGIDPLPELLAVGHRLTEAFGARLTELSTEHRRAMLLLAAGEGLDDRLLAVSVTSEAVAAGERAGLVDGLRFRHPLMRAAVYRRASLRERRSVHRRLAELVDPVADAERRAWHLAEAADEPTAELGDALETAGEAAHRRGARTAAARLFERAAPMAADPAQGHGRALRAAMLQNIYGDPASAVRCAELAATLAVDDSQRAAAALPRAAATWQQGDLDGPVSTEFLALAERFADLDPPTSAFAAIAAMHHSMLDSRLAQFPAALELMSTAISKVPEIPADNHAIAVVLHRVLGGERVELPLVDQLIALTDQLSTVFVQPEDTGAGGDFTVGLIYNAVVKLLSEEWADADRALRAIHEFNRGLDWGGFLSDGAVWAVEVLWRQGKWNDAFLVGNESLELLRGRGATTRGAWLVAIVAKVNAGLGRHERALELLAEAKVANRLLDCAVVTATIAHTEALLALAEERWDDALVALRSVRQAAGDIRHPNWLVWQTDELEVRARLGDPTAAAEVGGLLETADRLRLPVVRGAALRSRALLAPSAAEATASFGESVAVLGTTPSTFELARSLLAWAERTPAGKPERTTRADRAAQLFDGLGALRWRARARAVAERRSISDGFDGLTDQELRVALLVSSGASNKQIAAALGISTKTVEFHLGNTYRKTGMRSRTALAGSIGGRRDGAGQPRGTDEPPT